MLAMASYLEVHVLVPTDRISEFQRALASFTAADAIPAATPGSSGSPWRQVTVPVTDLSLPAFFSSFGAWLGQAMAPATVVSGPDLTSENLAALFPSLPWAERELLLLLSDDFGRPVGWGELKRKLLLSGKPCLSRDFPVLTQGCAGPPAVSFPVRQHGTGDDAVFSLPPELVDVVRTAYHAQR